MIKLPSLGIFLCLLTFEVSRSFYHHKFYRRSKIEANIGDIGQNVLKRMKKSEKAIGNIFHGAKKFASASALAVTFLARPGSYSPSKASTKSINFVEREMMERREDYNPTKIGNPIYAGTSFIRDAVRSVGPSVVRVDCDREIPPILGLFNDNYREGDTMKVGGSGFVISSDGFILTNAHVVDQAKRITVALSNGRVYKCRTVSSDELTDLALLKADIGSESLPPAVLGDSSQLHSGDWVIAVGNPAGLDFTVTLGIVSNPKRSAAEVGAPHMKGVFIQTDAALNQGNSGGPLVNEYGQVIGINTMVRSNTEAIGFAIPINRAKRIYDILKQGKKPSHAYFGVEVVSSSPDYAKIHNEDPNAQRLAEIHGALVVRVVPGSPAALSGLRKYDIITAVNGFAIPNSEEATSQLDLCIPGQYAKLTVARGETANEVQLEVSPQDLMSLIEDKRKRMQQVTGIKPGNF